MAPPPKKTKKKKLGKLVKKSENIFFQKWQSWGKMLLLKTVKKLGKMIKSEKTDKSGKILLLRNNKVRKIIK